jgi:hypothetical protein
MKRTTTLMRTLVAGGSALALVVTLAPLATATDAQGEASKAQKISIPKLPGMGDGFLSRVRGIEATGNGLENKAQAMLKKQIAKTGSAAPALTAALVAHRTARDTAIATFETSVKSAQDAYQAAIAPAAATLKLANATAKTALQNALQTASAATQAARTIYQAPGTWPFRAQELLVRAH